MEKTPALESAAKELVHAAFAENPVLASSPEVVAELKAVNKELASLKATLKDVVLEMNKSSNGLKAAVLELKGSSKADSQSIVAVLTESLKVQKIHFAMANAATMTYFPASISFKLKGQKYEIRDGDYSGNMPQLGNLIRDILSWFLKGQGVYLNNYDADIRYCTCKNQLSTDKAAQAGIVEALYGLTGQKPRIEKVGDKQELAIFWE